MTEIPYFHDLEAKNKEKLISLTDQGKKETGLMLPRKEVNYVTPQMQKTVKSDEFQEIPSNEVLLMVALYHSDRNMKTQEHCVLASQKLTDLRDALYCLSDHLGSHENLKSAYFFIENTFYNDMRGPGNINYSEKVIEWADENELYRQTGAWPLYSKKMEDVTFYDLNLRVGEKYLFCHHGNCKHYIIFSEVRLLNDQDEKNANCYPMMTYQSKIRRRKCHICDICSAKWVVWKDKYTCDDPTFYCDQCYRQFHYDENGKLLYDDFEVFNYHHE
jgi:snRNA-activating protein complex subunit 3